MRACPSCGFPINRRDLPVVCPKCDEDLIRAKARKPLVIDLAHRGETVSQALAKLDKAVSECLWHGHPSLKVIHGHGSGGGGLTHQAAGAGGVAQARRTAGRGDGGGWRQPGGAFAEVQVSSGEFAFCGRVLTEPLSRTGGRGNGGIAHVAAVELPRLRGLWGEKTS